MTSPSSDHPNNEHSILDEVDREGFEAGAFVRGILEREGLEGVLKAENGLVGEIRGLDGERKALVYDNYSKLIRATETIRRVWALAAPFNKAWNADICVLDANKYGPVNANHVDFSTCHITHCGDSCDAIEGARTEFTCSQRSRG